VHIDRSASSAAPVIPMNGGFARVWLFERTNCGFIKDSYNENQRRHILWQRGFNPMKPVSRRSLWTGEILYCQEIETLPFTPRFT